jgi:hypothetical protein
MPRQGFSLTAERVDKLNEGKERKKKKKKELEPTMKNELLKLPPIAVRDSVRAPIVVLCRIDGNIHFFASFFFSLR